MKILIANNSFKDVASPIELSFMIKDIIKNAIKCSGEVIVCPMCDGGEYTYDVLLHYCKMQEIFVDDVINPYRKKVRGKYLRYEEDAYIISSEILRLMPEDVSYKNPLFLTDFGLGQIVRHAIENKCKRIFLCLGGTSTVSYGLALAQALGISFYDKNDNTIEYPLAPIMYDRIKKIKKDKNSVIDALKNVEVIVVNDTKAVATEMDSISRLKIAPSFIDYSDKILEILDMSLRKACTLTGKRDDDEFSGNAGGICFGLSLLCNAKHVSGARFFLDMFDIETKIKDADIVITAEGRLDNIEMEKAPIVIAKLAKRYSKPLVFISGKKDESLLLSDLKKSGITHLINCEDFYDPNIISALREDYAKTIEYYKHHAREIILEKLGAILNSNEGIL